MARIPSATTRACHVGRRTFQSLALTNDRFANAYGILPQVLKGLIDRESAGWDTLAYRFEPKGWDWGMIKDQLGSAYNRDFRFEEPATSGVGSFSAGSFLGPHEIETRIQSKYPMKKGKKKYATSDCSYAVDVLHRSTNFPPVP